MRIGRKSGAALGLVAALAAGVAWRAVVDDQPRARADNAALVKRGDYLVNQVARCGDCHTPRDARGRLDLARNLQGAKMYYRPPKNAGEWEDKAPDITAGGKAGKWSERKMVTFLSTGKKSDPPMPAYRLTADDARAVTAYLRSLPGRKKGGRKGDD